MGVMSRLRSMWRRAQSAAPNYTGRMFLWSRSTDPDLPRDACDPIDAATIRAMNYSSIWCAMCHISNGLAQLPWRVYRRQGRARILEPDHPVDRLLHESPNPEMNAFDFKSAMIMNMLGYGACYAEVERARGGVPVALWPLEPRKMAIERDLTRTLHYIYDGREMKADSLLHWRYKTFDGVHAFGPVGLASMAVRLGLSLETLGEKFFSNGAMLHNVFEMPLGMSAEAANEFKKQVTEKHTGAERAAVPLYLPDGIQIKQLTMALGDAQFLESRRFQNEEIARWFNIPPHMLGDMTQAKFNNTELQNRQFKDQTLVPIGCVMEQEVDRKLLGEGLYCKFNYSAWMRADSAARTQFYKELWAVGALSINNILDLEDMNQIGPDGDERFVPLNMGVLRKVLGGEYEQKDGHGVVQPGALDGEDRAVGQEEDA